VRSALKIVAFSNGTKFDGIIALLETALAALDEENCREAAAYIDMAINSYNCKSRLKYNDGLEKAGIIN
jgi:hypothetical protein